MVAVQPYHEIGGMHHGDTCQMGDSSWTNIRKPQRMCPVTALLACTCTSGGALHCRIAELHALKVENHTRTLPLWPLNWRMHMTSHAGKTTEPVEQE